MDDRRRFRLFFPVIVVVLMSYPIPLFADFDITFDDTHLSVVLNNVKLIEHSPESAFVYAGSGEPTYEGQYGNYDVSDFVEERMALYDFGVDDSDPNRIQVNFSRSGLKPVRIYKNGHQNLFKGLKLPVNNKRTALFE